LKKQSAADTEKESPNNVLNIHTAMDYDIENNVNESQRNSELNTDNLHVSLNKILFCFIFLIIVRTYFCCNAQITRIQKKRTKYRN